MFISMRKNKLTQKKIAEETGLCREFICKVLNDKETISSTTAEKVVSSLIRNFGFKTKREDWVFHPHRIKAQIRAFNKGENNGSNR